MNPADSFDAGDRFAGAFSQKRSASPYGNSPASQGDAPTSPSYSNPTSPQQGGAATVAGLNPRSCVTCRKRKVKCDKRNPCSNCVKQHIDCIFPRPGRAPRKAKKPPDAELLARLRRLEGVVQKLGQGENGEQIAEEVGSAGGSSGIKSPDDRRPSSAATEIPDEPPSLSNPRDNPRFKGLPSGHGGSLKIEKEMGKLVVGEGKSRYVSNTFWASLTDEVAEMRDIINDSSESDEEDSVNNTLSPESQDSGSTNSRQTHQEFLFGYSSTMMTLRILHPPAKQVMTYWDIYCENIDPVIRILHKPTARHLFALAARAQSELSKSAEALVFAVYFGAVVSLPAETCQRQLGIDRETGLRRYRYATEQALARAGFLACQELIVVQAFTLFLACVRHHDENKAVWTLSGLLNRMALGIGLHRDGVQFNLSPFQTEMRRRLWWQVCTLDVRCSEDQGADPMVATTFFDTCMPSNVNDVDIWPDMKEPPIEHEKCTEMTFDLVRYEIGGTIRMLSAADSGSNLPESQQYASLEAKDALLEKLRLRLEDKYLRHCDMSVPLQWVAANVARLVMAKIWLVIHQPFRKANHGAKISQETRDRTFLTSIDVIRYSCMLWTQHKTSNWGWLFRTYFQWHAVAFLLSELCLRTTGAAVDEAWDVLTEALPDWEREDSSQRKNLMWKPLQKLIVKARRVRMEELARRRMFPSDGTLGVAPGLQQKQQQQLPMQQPVSFQQPQQFQQQQQQSAKRQQSTPSERSLLSNTNSSSTRGTSPGMLTNGMDMSTSAAPGHHLSIDPLARHLPEAGRSMGDLDPSSLPPDSQVFDALPTGGGMWLDDPFLLDNESWDANQTPWDNVGMDQALQGDTTMALDSFPQALWGGEGLGGTGF